MADRSGDSPGVVLARRVFYTLGSLGLVVAALYLGRNIFVPLALAVLLTLLLGPVVAYLERRGLQRVPAVLSAALLSFLLIGLVGWAVATQVTNLLDDLPRHKADMRARLDGPGGSGPLSSFKELLDDVENGEPAPGQVVRVEPVKPSALAQLQPVLARVLGAVSVVPVIGFLVVTLLLYREDTRNRLIRLAGRGRLTVTTRALDEAAHRTGGYLLGHATVNIGFGATLGLGLALLDVPYPLLWGLLATVFRFIPSVGVWLVAPLPVALAYVGGTTYPVLVLALFLVLELTTANVVEPRVCGRSIGLAPVPLLLAITFWTGLWGIVGLVLATPLTVCLAVLGRHVRPLSFLAILLGKEAALRPPVRYYQRLLARDRVEAEAVLKEYLTDHRTEELFDRVLIPALTLVRKGHKAGELQPEDEEYMLRTTREIVDGLKVPSADGATPDPVGAVTVLGVPAVNGVDEVALAMLRRMTPPDSGVTVLDGEPGRLLALTDAGSAVILIAAIGPGGLIEARYLCRRLRGQYPGAKILVGRWGRGKDSKKARALLLSAGADRVAATLQEARTQLIRLAGSHHPSPERDEIAPVA